ncbi:CGEA protein [Bacillus pfraonensis]|uniref:CGEA protein n=1 Tax=Bacillus TaxID=1386 RepID=UPI001574C22C|nr:MULTISPECIES: CGEA protein [unclassified Bacillus (in: firmicutes)]MBC6975854.1 CGEA protein [Bacillus sp. Xin]NSW35143.1 CGEA protein [Bacillus sp. Xin1]HEK9103249.1 CGEA protein [Bacillus pseudomycoides]
MAFLLCKSSICRQFANIPLGTIITVVGKSGFVYGPAKLIDFNNWTGIVTLEEEDLPSPSATNIIKISCNNVESIITTEE